MTEDELRHRLADEGWSAEGTERDVENFKRGASFRVHEYADLADGRRFTLHQERGFSMVANGAGGPEACVE